MTGRALALGWQPSWLVWPYGILLGLGARFLIFALFEGELLSPSGYLITTALIILVMSLAHRLYHVHQMVCQYPWLYEPRGWFAWQEKNSPTG